MVKPHISVYIPAYQGVSTLMATLRSILTSARADFEVVIRSNGSAGDTSDVIAGFNDPCIRLIRSEGTLSLLANQRATIEQARGELVKVVCADDLIHPDCLATQATLLEDPSLAPIACRHDFIDGNGRILTRNAGPPKLLGHRDVSEAARVTVRFGINPVGESAHVTSRCGDYDAIGGLNGSSVLVMDINAWLRILARGDMFSQPGAHAAFRIWTGSFSNSHSRQ